MTGAPQPSSPGVAAPAALAFAAIAFVALAIFGLGMTSLALNADVIAVGGLGQGPGVGGMLLATGGFAAALWAGLRAQHPSFWTAGVCAIAAYLGYLIGVFAGALTTGGDGAGAAAAVGGVAVGWPGLVIIAAAAISGWGGIALVRTRASRPRWPWERDEPED